MKPWPVPDHRLTYSHGALQRLFCGCRLPRRSSFPSIRSPLIALPATGTLTLSMSWYLAHGSNTSNADLFRISIVHSAGTTVLFTQTGAATNRNGAWSVGSWSVSQYAGQSIRVLIAAADAAGASLVEAGVDDVRITSA
jgi:hypothetical protein